LGERGSIRKEESATGEKKGKGGGIGQPKKKKGFFFGRGVKKEKGALGGKEKKNLKRKRGPLALSTDMLFHDSGKREKHIGRKVRKRKRGKRGW